MSKFQFGLIAALSAIAMTPAHAGQVITTAGGVSLGIQDMGALGEQSVGISLAGLGDGIMPGCLCEGWGAAIGAEAGWSGNSNGGNSNVSLVSFASGVNAATSIVDIGTSLRVSQAYGLSSSTALVKNTVTLTNLTGSAAVLRYTRVMDWDIPPTAFNEYVTIGGVGASKLVFSGDDGFATPNPLSNPSALVAGTSNVNVVDSGPADHGAFFTFDFGSVEAGKSVTFDIFYGAAASERAAMAALGEVGAEVYSLGQNSQAGGASDGTPGTYIFGFAGVGGTPVPAVPEPETYALMLAGVGVVALMARRRRTA